MPGVGFGFGSRRSASQYALLGQSRGPELVFPSPQWTGIAGTGFASSPAPVDPVRSTAKPVCRLLTPPNQYFTQELVVGVIALANDRGTLVTTLGLQKVLLHYEGTVHEITAPSFHVLEDANGKPRKYFGWWAVLGHNGLNGHASFYFEAIPRDPTMQRRVIGPYQASPRAARYDGQVTVTPSLPVVAGSRFQTLTAAMDYCRTAGFNNPLITITENSPAGKYDLAAGGAVYTPQGYFNIKATVPIVIGKLAYTNDAGTVFRPRIDGLHFIGSNITIDMRWIGQIYHEVPTGRQHWLDGCTITDSGGNYYLVRKAGKPTLSIARDNPWFTECTIGPVSDACVNAALVRGCVLDGGARDAMTDVACSVDTVVRNWGSWPWRNPIPSLTVRYIGTGATATLALSGGNSGSSRTFTAKVNGATVGTFTVLNSEAAFLAGTNYNVSNVVNWLNTLPGWTATLLDDTRYAVALGLTNGAPAFTDRDVKTAALTLVTSIDYHSDVFQMGLSLFENAVQWGSVSINGDVQSIISGNTAGLRDMAYVNCAFHNDPAGEIALAGATSQFNGPWSHLVVAHCSWATQNLTMRTDLSGASKFDADAYCAVINCTMPRFNWDAGPDPDLTVRNNHLQNGATVPSGSQGTTVGGTAASLFVNAGSGDFTPQGELMNALRPPVLQFDKRGFRRTAASPVGAIMQL